MHSQRIAQRRRRVALEQTQSVSAAPDLDESDDGPVSKRRKKTARPYEQGARRSRQFKTTDLIPKRGWSVAAILAMAFAAIAALNLLHLNSPDWIQLIGQEGVEALSLDSRTGLAVWYSNFLLLLTACVSLQLFLLRQHRRDDYRGSYRIWVFLAFVFLLASAASVTGIAAALKNVAGNFLGSNPIGNGIAIVLVFKLGGLLILFARTMVEVRHSRLAVLGLMLVVAAYGGAAVFSEVPAAQSKANEYVHSAFGNCLLFGATGIFLTALTFARFVYLEANGLVGRSKKRKANPEAQAEASSSGRRGEIVLTEVEQRSSWMESFRSRRQERQSQRESAREERLTAKADRKAEHSLEREAAREEKLQSRRRRQKEKAAAKELARQQLQEEAVDSNASHEAATRKPKEKRKPSKKQRVKSSNREQSQETARINEQPVSKPAINRQSSKKSSPLQSRVAKVVSSNRADQNSGRSGRPNSSNNSNSSAADDYLLSLEDEQVESLSKSDRRRLRKLRRRAA